MNLPELVGAKLADPEPVSLGESKNADSSDDDKKFKKARVYPEDDTSNPIIEFLNRHDHIGYSSEEISEARDKIPITKIKSAKGQYCSLGQYAIVWYKGWDETGALRYNNKDLGSRARPSIFHIGHYEVTKCWDIVL